MLTPNIYGEKKARESEKEKKRFQFYPLTILTLINHLSDLLFTKTRTSSTCTVPHSPISLTDSTSPPPSLSCAKTIPFRLKNVSNAPNYKSQIQKSPTENTTPPPPSLSPSHTKTHTPGPSLTRLASPRLAAPEPQSSNQVPSSTLQQRANFKLKLKTQPNSKFRDRERKGRGTGIAMRSADCCTETFKSEDDTATLTTPRSHYSDKGRKAKKQRSEALRLRFISSIVYR